MWLYSRNFSFPRCKPIYVKWELDYLGYCLHSLNLSSKIYTLLCQLMNFTSLYYTDMNYIYPMCIYPTHKVTLQVQMEVICNFFGLLA